MQFEEGCLYHIYNRGNNSQLLFYNHGNYHFFLRKISEHILPHADIIAWCLMPNHFHLMVEVKKEFIELPLSYVEESDSICYHSGNIKKLKLRTFNESIGIILQSYTRAIQKQEGLTGSLFQKNTKAVCLNESELIPAWYNSSIGTVVNIQNPEMEYPNICFNYIHQNPVNNGLVNKPEDWEFSSYKDYKSMNVKAIVNFERARILGLI
jgi:putative transposase